jgi:DNA-binding CsgD family transcriptional regulator
VQGVKKTLTAEINAVHLDKVDDCFLELWERCNNIAHGVLRTKAFFTLKMPSLRRFSRNSQSSTPPSAALLCWISTKSHTKVESIDIQGIHKRMVRFHWRLIFGPHHYFVYALYINLRP